MKFKIKMTLKITPFGSINYETDSLEKSRKEDLTEIPQYVEPTTTNIKSLDLNNEKENIHIISETTA